MKIANRKALPGFLGFVALAVALCFPDLDQAMPYLAPLIAALTAANFVHLYLSTPMQAKRLAAAMGGTIAITAGLLSFGGPLWVAAAIVVTFAGLGAATANTFFNYCLGCEIHNRYLNVRR